MRKKLKIDSKNVAIAESLLYSLQIHFRAADFHLDEEDSMIRFDCDGQAAATRIEKHAVAFLKKVSKVAHRVCPRRLSGCRDEHEINCKPKADMFLASRTEGVYAMPPDTMRVALLMDKIFCVFAKEQNALPIGIPSLISTSDLEKSGYITRNAHQLGRVKTQKSKGPQFCLTPAGCLPLYPILARSATVFPHTVFTALCRVYRHEGGNFDTHMPFARMGEFHMREIIFISNPRKMERIRNDYMRFLSDFLKWINVPFKISTASDVFFTPENSRYALHQLLHATKIECSARVNKKRIALSSFNNHDNHFISSFGIKTQESSMRTFCIGFGVERFVGVALLANTHRRLMSLLQRYYLKNK